MYKLVAVAALLLGILATSAADQPAGLDKGVTHYTSGIDLLCSQTRTDDVEFLAPQPDAVTPESATCNIFPHSLPDGYLAPDYTAPIRGPPIVRQTSNRKHP